MGASWLNINLQAIEANYHFLDQCSSSKTRTGAAVKADAYGLGMVPVSTALYTSGCRQFFAAQLTEAVCLRQAINQQDCRIFVLEGPHNNELPDYQNYQLTPVVNTADQLNRVSTFNRTATAPLACAVHVDTAMNRLGLDGSGLNDLSQITTTGNELPVCLVMSHLACADEPAHRLNAFQLETFTKLSEAFAQTPKSLSNSAGILLGKPFHFDLTRPGISLYGAMSDPAIANDGLQPVFTWQADILQIRTIEKGQTVGYGAEFIAQRRTRLATIGAGYADGYDRALFRPEQGRTAAVGIGGYAAPLAGRVSMDLIVADVSDVPDSVLEKAQYAELLWEGYKLEQMAIDRGTIAYEVMTGLGGRIKRHYDGRTSGSVLTSRQTTPEIKV